MSQRRHRDKYSHLRPPLNRQCRRGDGVPKWRYASREAAQVEADKWEGYEPYQCDECAWWHIGQRKEPAVPHGDPKFVQQQIQEMAAHYPAGTEVSVLEELRQRVAEAQEVRDQLHHCIHELRGGIEEAREVAEALRVAVRAEVNAGINRRLTQELDRVIGQMDEAVDLTRQADLARQASRDTE